MYSGVGAGSFGAFLGFGGSSFFNSFALAISESEARINKVHDESPTGLLLESV